MAHEKILLKECPFCKNNSHLCFGMMNEEFWWTDEPDECEYISILCTSCNLIKFQPVHSPTMIDFAENKLAESWNKRD